MVGVATAAVVYFGFSRTRENANTRSREALEELGQQNLQEIANSQASLGALQLEWAGEIGQRAGQYMQSFKASGATAPYDVSRLVLSPRGLWIDPDPNRPTDVVVLPQYMSTRGALDDLAYAASLNAILPALISGFPHEIADESFHPTAITYVSINGTGMYYPPRGSLYETVPPDIDLANIFDNMSPENDPERKTLWTSPYQDVAGQGLVITALTPVYEGDTLRGRFEVDLRIDNLSDTVNQIKPTENGFAFYVDVEGKILRTDAYDLLTNELQSQDNQVLASLVRRMQAGDRGVERVSMGGQDFFVAFAPILEVGGGLGVVAPVSELTAEAAAITAGIDHHADQTMTVVLTSLAVMFALAIVGATYLNRRVLIRPIEALVEGTRAVAQGKLETRIAVTGSDELAALGHSFNRMTAEMLQRDESLRREAREREAAQEELRALFAAMTDRVIVFDSNGRVVRLPDTNAPDLGLSPEELLHMTLRDLVPDDQAERVLESIRRALRERVTVTEEYPYEAGDQTHWFSSAFSPIAADEVVMVARDITDRVNARQELERQVQERTQELRALLDVSGNVASTLELGPLLTLVIQQIGRVVDHWRASLFLVQEGGLFMVNSRVNDGDASSEGTIGRRLLTFEELQPFWGELSAGRAVIIDDVQDGSEMALVYQRVTAGRAPEVFGRTRSFLAAPLVLKDQTIGMLSVAHEEAAFYTEDHARLLAAFATQAAIAVENARLYEQVQARGQELQTLLNVSRNVASTLELGPLLQTIIEQLKDIADYSRCSIFLLEGDSIVLLDSRSVASPGAVEMRIPLDVIEALWGPISVGQPVIIEDVRGDSAFAAAYRRGSGDLLETAFSDIHSWMGVPLESKDRLIGMLTLSHNEASYYTEHHAGLVTGVATQIAVAIENARLYEQAQQLAAVEERQRLARELHDSVSQALYGIALGARTARTLLDRDPAKAAEPVDYVLSLAEAGLAEMRALIFELRPESLEIEGLVAALDKQIAATAARHGIEVNADLVEEPEMSLAQKEIFYRIGQEALHNVVKHAHASKATVRLARDNGSFVLEVGDNGVGFDVSQNFPGHMGLVSMSERASSIGARLEVESAPGKGTVIKLRSARL